MKILTVIIGLMIIFFTPAVLLFAEEFTSADHKDFELMTNTLEKWYQLNQIGQPKSESELKNNIKTLFYIRDESEKVSDSFLKKFNPDFAFMYRNKFQVGAGKYAEGLQGLMKNRNDTNSKSMAISGQKLMVEFHQWYNKNIGKIMHDLKRRGVKVY
jgi:hypothetical protein